MQLAPYSVPTRYSRRSWTARSTTARTKRPACPFTALRSGNAPKEQLQGIDTLIYDIQDIGCRFYTYETTLGYLLETAAEHKLKVVVLNGPILLAGWPWKVRC